MHDLVIHIAGIYSLLSQKIANYYVETLSQLSFRSTRYLCGGGEHLDTSSRPELQSKQNFMSTMALTKMCEYPALLFLLLLLTSV